MSIAIVHKKLPIAIVHEKLSIAIVHTTVNYDTASNFVYYNSSTKTSSLSRVHRKAVSYKRCMQNWSSVKVTKTGNDWSVTGCPTCDIFYSFFLLIVVLGTTNPFVGSSCGQPKTKIAIKQTKVIKSNSNYKRFWLQ